MRQADSVSFDRNLATRAKGWWDMGTLHVTPGLSAAASLTQAVGDAAIDTEVMGFPDDLSCGPIDSYVGRGAWWAGQFPEEDENKIEKDVSSFWDQVTADNKRLLVWFGRHSSMEYAFFLAMIDRLADRPYTVIDVTGTRYAFERHDGSPALSEPAQAVSLIGPPGLRSLLASHRPLTAGEKKEAQRTWQLLRAENAPFRVVTETGLVSAPADHFDPLIMERVTADWRKTARVIGDTMGYNQKPYIQVGDAMLLMRVVALIERGKILAEGDPWDMHASRVRLPEPR